MNDDVKTFSDYMAILLRRKITIVMVFMAVALAGVYVTYSIESTYLSSATFRVQRQNISADLVQTTVTGVVDEQIQLVRQRVMSVDSLSEVIDRFGLYQNTTNGGAANYYAVEKLRSAVELEPEYTEVFNPRSGRTNLVTIAFEVQFEYSDPGKTQSVMAEIADRILIENRRNRSAQVEQTIAFLERDLESSQRDVDRAAESMADFRELHAGNLPDMTDFNLQAVQRTERQIEALDADIRDARDRKHVLEGELADPDLLATTYDEEGNPIVGTAGRLAELQRERIRLLSIYSAQHPDVISIEKEINILASDLSASGNSAPDIQNQLNSKRTELAIARQKYADDHPDVRRLANAIENLKRQLSVALQQPAPSVQMATQDPVARQLQLRIEDQDADIRAFQSRRAVLVAKVADYERKLLRMPQIEREYAGLKRDSDAAISRNTDTREKLDEARTAGKLESEGEGARFILTDSPQLPDKPDKPNRASLLILSFVLAAIFGMTTAITVDAMDKTVKDTRDVLQVTTAPPLAVIPYLETPGDYRKRIGLNVVTSGLVLGGIALALFIARSADLPLS